MFGRCRVKIKRGLYKRAREFALKAGYASLEEFIEHLLEREISCITESDSENEAKRRLKGLGYIS